MKLIRKPVEEEKDKEPSIGNFIFKLLPYWPLFLILFIVATACAWVYLQITTPVYDITARVLIRDDKKNGDDAKTLSSLDIVSPKRSVDNEIEVIQSKDLINHVVNDLNLYAPVFSEGRYRDSLAYTSSPIIVSTNDIRTLIPAKKVYFKVTGEAVYINKARYPLNMLVSTPYGNLKFVKNPHQTEMSSDKVFYFSLLNPKKVVAAISSKLKVSSANKLATVIDIDYKDESPLRGEDIVNDLINAYKLSIAEEKNVLASNTEKFLNERLTTVENNLLATEHKQQSYQSNRGAIDIGTQGKLYLENVSTNDQKLSQINMQLSVLDQIESYVKSKNLSNGIVPSTAGVDDPGLTQMVKNIYELQIELESLKKTTGENNPLVISYNDRIEKIRPQILENLQNQRSSLLASKNNLSSTNRGYSSQLQTIPETQKTLVDINRELSIESNVYTYLLQKKEETALSFISNEDGSTIVEKANSSDNPVSPKRKIIYIASTLISLIIGGAFVSGKESLQSNIMYQSDIETLTQLPIIGEISSSESKEPIVIGHNSQRTLIAEQFRRLRTTLSYLGIGGIKKRILITSAISGEGKSFVALNLAVSLALTGKRIVLIDFDLNNPSLHQKLKMEKDVGVTEFLEGKASINSIIRDTQISKNLFFISAGNLSETPSELITNGKPEELLIELDNLFDFVVIDVAPVGPVSDAYILSPICDATLYIIRHAYTPKIFVQRIDKNNELNKLNNAAIIFNDVSNRSFAHYGYGYGYGYVYENKKDKKRLT
ncbi:MAG: capsular exopolysaccharide family [Mucilaginibacter sp.]|nr:capsular exopolysaccharide family [Mucilaginibacter sp.]